MIASPQKKPTISLSTRGPRGTAGLVEEWESRIPIQEKHQQSRRGSTVFTPPPGSTTKGEASKKE
jgi:hypothetical protein